ncbi:nitroreductase family protein [Halomarina pelagica]|uniref:nitroreductase family protein n=1 Tax=Halomarina pelagica TaxID=2961599 RepID=UPI0020C33ABD|nr:nitroreductase family protein [Halomarina sp. BND7]
MARIGQLAVTYLDLGEREGAKNSKLITSAPTVALLTTPDDSVEAHVRTGQVFERLMLAATRKSVAVHPMSQILERPDLKRELAEELEITDATPQHLFRLGYAEDDDEETHTPRWPVTTVLR